MLFQLGNMGMLAGYFVIEQHMSIYCVFPRTCALLEALNFPSTLSPFEEVNVPRNPYFSTVFFRTLLSYPHRSPFCRTENTYICRTSRQCRWTVGWLSRFAHTERSTTKLETYVGAVLPAGQSKRGENYLPVRNVVTTLFPEVRWVIFC